MKQKLLTLATLLLCAVSGAWAQTTFITKSGVDEISWSNNDGTRAATLDGITVSFNKVGSNSNNGIGSGYSSLKKNNTLSVSCTSNKISKIVFTFTEKDRGPLKNDDISTGFPITDDNGSIAADGESETVFIWTGSTNSVTFTNGIGQDMRTTQIVVTVETEPDVTAPTLSSSTPADGATDVALSGNITLTFSENVTIADASKFTLTGGAGTLSTASASVSGTTVTIPYSGLAASTNYTLSTAAGAVEDAAGNANAALSDIAFTTTSNTYEFTAPVKYALAEGDAFSSGQMVNVTDAGTIVATITYGETGGADFKAAAANCSITGYTAFTEGNGTNGNKTGGTFYTIVPKYDCLISVAVALNNGKAFYIEENGVALSTYNGITVDEKYYGTFEFKATKGKSYKVYCAGSKLGFYGFTMSPYAEATIATSGYTSLASSYALDFTKAVKSASGDDALTAYAISAITKTSVTLTAVEQAPASEGLILKGTANETYTIPALASADAITNELSGAVTATAVAASSTYALSGGVLKLFTGTEIPAGKAYLLASKIPASANELALDFGEGDVTGIQNVEKAQVELLKGDFYNLAGQRVAQPAKGLYIVNGKKVILK